MKDVLEDMSTVRVNQPLKFCAYLVLSSSGSILPVHFSPWLGLCLTQCIYLLVKVNPEVLQDMFTEAPGFFNSAPGCSRRTWVWTPMVRLRNGSILLSGSGASSVLGLENHLPKLLPKI
jgi:hypothetical protein